MKLFYVYIVQCADNSFYIGVTSNLNKRIDEHNCGLNSTSYTFSRRPVILKWFETFSKAEEVFKVEKQLKGWSRKKKLPLINEDWEKLVEYSKNHTQHKSSTGTD